MIAKHVQSWGRPRNSQLVLVCRLILISQIPHRLCVLVKIEGAYVGSCALVRHVSLFLHRDFPAIQFEHPRIRTGRCVAQHTTRTSHQGLLGRLAASLASSLHFLDCLLGFFHASVDIHQQSPEEISYSFYIHCGTLLRRCSPCTITDSVESAIRNGLKLYLSTSRMGHLSLYMC